MNESKLKYQIGLTLIKGVGAATAKKLITALGSEDTIFNTKKWRSNSRTIVAIPCLQLSYRTLGKS